MPSTRRTFLGTLGAAALGGLSGCAGLGGGSGDPAMVTVEFGGSLDNERGVELEVVADSASDDLSDNVLFQQAVTVGPDGLVDGDGEYVDAFEAQRALVRVSVGGVGVVGEYTFVPDCTGTTELDDVLHVSIHSPLDVSFRQNRCR
ncbi:MAG: hypothetical protein ABEH83_01590 [Halobacterium sp.]